MSGVLALSMATGASMLAHRTLEGPYIDIMCTDYRPDVHGALTGLEEDDYWTTYCEEH